MLSTLMHPLASVTAFLIEVVKQLFQTKSPDDFYRTPTASAPPAVSAYPDTAREAATRGSPSHVRGTEARPVGRVFIDLNVALLKPFSYN